MVAKNKNDGAPKEKKDREPIFYTCGVVLMIMIVALVGSWAYGEYVETDDSVADAGSSVTVSYTGSFYDYYGEDNAVVFDTSSESIAKKAVTSNTFSKTKFSELTFKVNGGTVLQGFNDAVYGKKVGDSVKVEIPAGEGYNAYSNVITKDISSDLTVDAVEKMTTATFESLYSDLKPMNINREFKSVYGWDASSEYDANTGMVLVTYHAEADKEYEMYNGSFGKIVSKVSSVDNGVITYKMNISDYKVVGKDTLSGKAQIQMIKTVVDNKVVFITELVLDGDDVKSIVMKDTAENSGEKLYFIITIKSIQ